MRIAIIGAGKIGFTILSALKKMPNIELIATGRSSSTLEKIKSIGVEATTDNDYAVSSSDYIILSVKPQHFPSVLKSVKSWEGKKVISVMAGISISTLSSFLKGSKVYRAMPNINAMVGKSTTALAEERDETVEKIFLQIGKVYWVPEELMDVWTALIGSGPAFMAEIIDALSLGAVECVMPRELSYNAILDMIEGTVELLRKCRHPALLRDQVTTPAGTTIRGLMTMESEGIKSALIKTVEAAYKRSVEIGEQIDRKLRTSFPI